MAPETLQNPKKLPYSQCSDIWSLCCTLYELFCETKVWKVKSATKEEFLQFYKARIVPPMDKVPSVHVDILEFGMSYLAYARPSAKKLVEHFEEYGQ